MKLIIISIITTSISYLKVLNGFFQQDEWLGYSEFILRRGYNLSNLLKCFFAPTSIAHYTPFTLAILYSNRYFFGMNYFPHAIISLTLHIIIVFLVYLLSKELMKSKFYAGIVTIIFASFSSGYQATSWVMADIGTHGSTIFGILSIISFINFLNNKNKKKFILSLVFLLISLLFKEITLGLLPVMIYLLWNNKLFKRVEKLKYTKRIIFSGVIYVLARISMVPMVSSQPSSTGLIFESQSKIKLLYDFVTIPIKAVSQSIIPIEIMRSLAEFTARLFPRSISSEIGSPAFEVFVVKRVLEFVSLSLSLIIVFLVSLKKNRTSIMILGLVWIVVNSLIFAFSPQRTGITSVIDSRNLYFVSIGASLLLTTIFEKIRRRNKIASIIFVSVILLPNLFFLNRNLSNFVKVSSVRKEILNHITKVVPQLPQKVVIYTQSSQSYYGLPEEEKIMPFQSGFGQTLLVWYYQRNKLPTDFFEDRFLWEIDSQGYKEIDGVGFGYFRDLDLLIDTIKQYNLPIESIVGFYWDGRRNTLEDISEELRVKIND